MGYGYVYPYHRHKSIDSPVDFTHEDIDTEGRAKTCLRQLIPSLLIWLHKLLLLVWFFIVFSAACAILLSTYNMRKQDYPHGLIVADDLTQNVPHFESEIQMFQIIPGYTIDPLNATEAEVERLKATWTKLMPAGRGFVKANSSLDQLPHGVLDPDTGNFEWSVAIFHQLHCLYAIMKDYNDGVRGLPTHPKHTRHCFEYLRISLMCYSDTTLEGRDPASHGQGTDTTGMGAKHVCKKFPEVFDWTLAHRRSNGIGIA